MGFCETKGNEPEPLEALGWSLPKTAQPFTTHIADLPGCLKRQHGAGTCFPGADWLTVAQSPSQQDGQSG